MFAQSPEPEADDKVLDNSRSNWNLEMLIFEERGKPEYPEKNLSEQSREPTTNWTHIWRRVRESNPGHIGERRALSPLRHPCSPPLPCSPCSPSPPQERLFGVLNYALSNHMDSTKGASLIPRIGFFNIANTILFILFQAFPPLLRFCCKRPPKEPVGVSRILHLLLVVFASSKWSYLGIGGLIERF